VLSGKYAIRNDEDLYAAIRLHHPGEMVRVVFQRNSADWEVDIRLISRQEYADRFPQE